MSNIIVEENNSTQDDKSEIKKGLNLGFGYIGPRQTTVNDNEVSTQIFNVDNHINNTDIKKVNHTNSYRFNNKKRLDFNHIKNRNRNKNKSQNDDFDFNEDIERITYSHDDIITTSASISTSASASAFGDSLISYQSNKNTSELEKRLGQTIINNPYDEEIFERFEDCFVSDGVSQKTLIRKYSLINGHDYTFSLALEYKSEDDKEDRKNLKTVNDFKEYKNALNEIRYRLEKADFYNYDFKASVLKSVFGRAVLEKIHNTLDYGIINFNLLYNQALGDPIIDETNQLIGVEYEYTKKAQKENSNFNSSTEGNKAKIIDIDKLIYYLNEDIPVSLGSSYFGLSEFESIVDASEGKKMILQTQSKEAIQTSYRGTGVFRTTEPMPDSKLSELAVKINEHRGNSFVMDQSIVGGFENTASNPEKMMIFLNEFNLEIIRGLNSMQSLGGYENAQNFATLDKYSTIYLKSVIIPKQNEHKRFIKKMLLDEMFTVSLLRQGYAILLDKQDYIKKLYKVTLKPLVDVVNTKKNGEDGINVKVSMKPGYAIKDQYKEILKIQNDKIEKEESEIFTFTKTDIPTACVELNLEIPDFIEIQEYFKMMLDLYKNKLATVKKVLQSVNMEDQIEEIEQLQQEAKEEEERRFSMQLLVNDSGNNDNDRPKQEKQNKLLTQKADNNKNKKKTLAK